MWSVSLIDFPKKKTTIVPILPVPLAPLEPYSKCLSMHFFLLFLFSSEQNRRAFFALYLREWTLANVPVHQHKNKLQFWIRIPLFVMRWPLFVDPNCNVNCFCLPLALAFFIYWNAVNVFGFFGMKKFFAIFGATLFLLSTTPMCISLRFHVCEIWKPFNIWVSEWNMFSLSFHRTNWVFVIETLYMRREFDIAHDVFCFIVVFSRKKKNKIIHCVCVRFWSWTLLFYGVWIEIRTLF